MCVCEIVPLTGFKPPQAQSKQQVGGCYIFIVLIVQYTCSTYKHKHIMSNIAIGWIIYEFRKMSSESVLVEITSKYLRETYRKPPKTVRRSPGKKAHTFFEHIFFFHVLRASPS